MPPVCLVTLALHAATLAEDVTSQVTVLMPSSASCFRASILHTYSFVDGIVHIDMHLSIPLLGGGHYMSPSAHFCMPARLCNKLLRYVEGSPVQQGMEKWYY